MSTAAATCRLAIGVVVTAALAGVASVSLPVVARSAPLAGALPRTQTGCSAKAVTKPTSLRLTMASTLEGKVPVVAVCIHGKGPYPFLVSTGAGNSVVSQTLARTLHLKKRSTSAVRGVTCITSARSASVSKWSMAGRKLAPQKVLVANVPADGVSPPPMGVIGSDVLVRFGAVRIDYQKDRLVVDGKEGAAPANNVYVLGRSDDSVPPGVARGAIKASVILRILEAPQGTIVAAPVKISGHTEQLAVESGSASSSVLPSVASSLKLKSGGAKAALAGIGCHGSGSTFTSGSWALAGSALPKTSLVARKIPGSVNSGLQGALGSDVLSADGSVIIDYAGAHLWLTAG